MTKIAVWIVLSDGVELLEVPYKDKPVAEEYMTAFNDVDCPGMPKCYLNLVKKPVEKFPDTIKTVNTWNVRIGGTNKETGEGWSKTYHHVEVLSMVLDKYTVRTKFVGHRYRGEYRVSGPGGSLNLEAFSKWATKRWPKEHQRVILEFLI